MKTLQDVRNDIAETVDLIRQAEAKSDRKSKTLAKKLRAKLVELRSYALYLETEPTQETVEAAAQKVSDTIERITSHFEAQYGASNVQAKKKASYLKERGVPKLRQQLSQLNYLLA